MIGKKYEWRKIDTGTNAAGEKVITYELDGSKRWILVQSTRKKIPHANRSGYWEKTFFSMIFRGVQDPREYASLTAAMCEAERIGKKLGYLDGPPETLPDKESDDLDAEVMRTRIRNTYGEG